MEELHRQMAHEKRDWVQQRGLVHGHCAFSLFMTPQFRSMYDSEYAILLNRHILDWERGDINSNARNIEMKGMKYVLHAIIALSHCKYCPLWSHPSSHSHSHSHTFSHFSSSSPPSLSLSFFLSFFLSLSCSGMTDLVDAEVVKATDNLTRFLIDFFDNHLHYHKVQLCISFPLSPFTSSSTTFRIYVYII